MADVRVATIAEGRAKAVTHLRLVRIEDIRGARVRNPEGEEIGSVRDYVLDLNSGAIVYAALAFGGMLGVAEKMFAIPREALVPEAGQGAFCAGIQKERLERLPGFDGTARPIAGDWTPVGSARPLPVEVQEPSRLREEAATAIAPIRPLTPIAPVGATQTARSGGEVVIPVESRAEPLPAEGASRASPPAEMPLATPPASLAGAERHAGAAHTRLIAADLQQSLRGVDCPSDKQGLNRQGAGARRLS